MNRLDGKVALISGAARGIGAETARLMVEAGAKVAIGDMLDERARDTARRLGEAALYVHLDVTSEADWQAAIDAVLGRWGRLDILVNNAGIRKYEKVDKASAESWNEILGVNLMSYVFCAKAAVPLMRGDKGGAIVNVASVRSIVSGGGNLQYDTTKAAIAG